MSLASAIGIVGLALLQGAIVALPRADSLTHLRRLRSPAWAAMLPGALIVGTFGVLAFASMAQALVVLAAVATPILAFIAVMGVVRGRRLFLVPLLVAIATAVVVTRGAGWSGKCAASLLTALGCLCLGTVLVRLIPGRLLTAGVVAMCAVDVLLMALGFGQFSWRAVHLATVHFHGPAFDQAAIGPASIDYVDLVLAAVVGVVLSGQAGLQRRAAALVTILATANGMLAIVLASRLPATVPMVLALGLLRAHNRPGRSLRPPLPSRSAPQLLVAPPARRIGLV